MTRVGEVDLSHGTLDQRQHAAWQSFGLEWTDFKAAWIGRGLKSPPAGSADDDPEAESPSQRALLWSVMDAQPTNLPAWITAAPKGLGAAAVIGYVLKAWHAERDAALERELTEAADWQATKDRERSEATAAPDWLAPG